MKQRLAGAVVLGCLAIIFIPILLDGEGLDSPEITGNIPAPPPMPETPDTTPQRPEILADTLPAEPVPELESETGDTESAISNTASEAGDTEAETPEETAAVPADEPVLDEQGIPATWSVRLASFGERANADALVMRLMEDGYKAYRRPVESGQSTLTGVFVGPVITRAQAQGLLAELNDAYELDGIVVQFTIDEPE